MSAFRPIKKKIIYNIYITYTTHKWYTLSFRQIPVIGYERYARGRFMRNKITIDRSELFNVTNQTFEFLTRTLRTNTKTCTDFWQLWVERFKWFTFLVSNNFLRCGTNERRGPPNAIVWTLSLLDVVTKSKVIKLNHNTVLYLITLILRVYKINIITIECTYDL